MKWSPAVPKPTGVFRASRLVSLPSIELTRAARARSSDWAAHAAACVSRVRPGKDREGRETPTSPTNPTWNGTASNRAARGNVMRVAANRFAAGHPTLRISGCCAADLIFFVFLSPRARSCCASWGKQKDETTLESRTYRITNWREANIATLVTPQIAQGGRRGGKKSTINPADISFSSAEMGLSLTPRPLGGVGGCLCRFDMPKLAASA